jgi:ketosteroid isomerase-like protein
MRKNTFLALVVPLLSLLFLAVGAAAQPDTDQEFMRLEQVWNQAHLNNDAAVLETLWADDLTVMVPGMAAMGKSDVLSFVKTGRMKFSRYETTDLKVRSFGDTAIVSGNLFRSRTLGGTLREDRWQFMKVYARRSGKWMVVAFTATEAPGP